MKSYPMSREVSGSIIVVVTLTVSTAAGKLAAVDIRDSELDLASMCPWLGRALTQGNPDEPTEEQVTDAVTAFQARAILRSVEAVLVSGPAVQLAYTATLDDEEEDVFSAVGTGYVQASSDVPVRGLIWPNIAHEHVFYWGTNDEGEATVELTIGIDVLPEPGSQHDRLLKA